MENNKFENKKLTKDNICVLLDFDRTITSCNSFDSWTIAGLATEKECIKHINDLYEMYRPIEMDYNIAVDEKNKKMEEWYNSCMKLYYKYNFNRNKLKEIIEQNHLIFRDGAKEFLEFLYKRKIPVVILSAGVGSVIEEFLKYKNCYYKNILLISNKFIYDNNGNAIKLENSLIHTMNKTSNGNLTGMWKLEFSKRPYRILIGDTIEDINMVSKEELSKTLKIAFLDDNKENLQKYRQKFDVVLTDENANFNKIIDIIDI